MFSFFSQRNSNIKKISAKEAKNLMDHEKEIIVLDVRTKEEYKEGHIKGAVLLPLDQINGKSLNQLPNKEQMILVYCHSGGRSSLGASQLAGLGYTKVYDFGGIISWPYEVVRS